MGPRPILKPTFDNTVPEPDGPCESSSGSPTAKVKPGPLPLPFASCSQAQFLLLEHSPHVHFPPSPCLVRSGITHSPGTYDRAPIEVSPNQCEIPARGCRVYEIGGGNGALRNRKVVTPAAGLRAKSNTRPAGVDGNDVESYFDPRTFESCRDTVTSIRQEEGEDNDHRGINHHNPNWHVLTKTVPPRMTLLALRDSRSAPNLPCAYSSSPSLSSESESEDSEPDESTCPPRTQDISHDSSAHLPPPTTLNTLTLTLLPCAYPCSCASLSLKKKRSSSTCGDTTRRWRRKLQPTRSRSIDSLTYARWNVDNSTSININKRVSTSDPSLDGCLGGF